MIIIENKKKCVIVLKAVGQPDLRLFPGYNKIGVKSEKDLEPYLNSKVAKAVFKESLKFSSDELDSDDMAQAQEAKKKNDALNKSAFIIKKQELELAKKDNELDGKNEKLATYQKEIDELKSNQNQLLYAVKNLKKLLEDNGIEILESNDKE